MKQHLVSALAAACGLGVVPYAHSHHAFAAEYDISKPITLQGTLTKLAWINPHGWIYIKTVDANGKITDWSVEFGSPNALLRHGLRKSDFVVGNKLTVNGYRSKNGEPVIAATTVKLPDGRDIYAGSDNPDAPKE